MAKPIHSINLCIIDFEPFSFLSRLRFLEILFSSSHRSHRSTQCNATCTFPHDASNCTSILNEAWHMTSPQSLLPFDVNDYYYYYYGSVVVIFSGRIQALMDSTYAKAHSPFFPAILLLSYENQSTLCNVNPRTRTHTRQLHYNCIYRQPVNNSE